MTASRACNYLQNAAATTYKKFLQFYAKRSCKKQAVFFFAISMGHPRSSILSQAVILVAEIGIYSVCVELLTRRYYAVPMALSWSAIVLTCAIIIDVTLVTILLRSRLREEVRRRMHI